MQNAEVHAVESYTALQQRSGIFACCGIKDRLERNATVRTLSMHKAHAFALPSADKHAAETNWGRRGIAVRSTTAPFELLSNTQNCRRSVKSTALAQRPIGVLWKCH